ncbi:universal stress protein [Cryptosporangium arvum]|uniref:Universal stress protein UspA-like protein n=1 Tax=Cryptosporangium arvum DSM 44712 TaxID=927661 RepID=A0A010ZZ23_9ACTN|nr:universal stress protein [Cryptosporangium arvum]EXG82467.1 universal stress protein UspA-like protein [Cryptosporangium arvum DSM 44712]
MNENEGRIVVGIDGSDPSKQALAWAVRQARLTGAQIDAVIAWHPVVVFGYMPPPGDFDVEGAARSALADVIDKTAADAGDVPIHPRVIEGAATRVLVDAARGAQLLVVGNRGHAGFTEALLGSIGQYCVHHAACPVVVVRGSDGEDT